MALKIRKQQMSEFDAAARAGADRALARRLRERFPERFDGTTDDELAAFVADVRMRAECRDVVEDEDVASAADLSVMYGPNFYAAEWARDLFEVSDWSGAERMEALRARVRARVPDF
jgi:hypothetical protein